MEHDLLWHGMKVGDLATWIAGIATFLAVCAAIGVPWIQWCRERKERREQEARSAQIMAIELSELFIRLRRDMIDIRSILAIASAGEFNGNPAGLIMHTQLWGTQELPHGADLQNLPYPVAPAIAAFRSMAAMYNGSVGLLEKHIAHKNVDDAVKDLRLSDMLDAAQAALARAARHMGCYEPSYRLLDYFDKGDGTRVKPLEDYGDRFR